MGGKFCIPEEDFVIKREELHKESVTQEVPTQEVVTQEVQEVQEKKTKKREKAHENSPRINVYNPSPNTLYEIGDTQGRRGAKLPRINLAFSTVNHEFIRREAKREGVSITFYLNTLLDKVRRGEIDTTKWF